ncbi:OmpA family protein [Actinomadura sp. NBRC 104425]|uniref:OmpA family protein n=1 Tax=Actinomadura sp. NBRC 104425 TaxID=3032204 RepID=UPI002556688F|nr:OmpA family protein [Actinomadura sp. NBRC 104425]
MVAAAMVLSACSSSGGSEGGKQSPSASPTSGSQSGGERVLQTQPYLPTGEVKFDLLALDRVSDQVVVAKLRARNTTRSTVSLGRIMVPTARKDAGENFDSDSVGGMALLDGVNMRLYHPYVQPGRKCLCTKSFGGFLTLPANGTLTLHAAFPAPPAEVSRLGLIVPGVLPFTDVPVGNRTGVKIDIDENNRGVDPVTAQKGPTRILPVTTITQNNVGFEEDDGTNLNVNISTDVLFAVNKADLNAEAQATLREVSQKIQNSPGNTVTIEGHADSTGNDAINQPLSERRAKSVENALKQMVTRQGITYRSQGFGSKRPIASNSTEEGRRKNRRVVISFARPKPAPAQTPSASAAPAPGSTLNPKSGPKGTSIHVDELHRDSNGFTTVSFTLRNDGDQTAYAGTMFTAPAEDGYILEGTSAVSLVSGDRRFRAVRDGDGYAIGPRFATMTPDVPLVVKGEQLRLYTMIKVPSDVTTVTLEIPGYEKAENLTIN